ncbi:MAG: hypothetical protein IJE41_00600, partial [Clostridia bacterium]|nr:hypothetical protein [Clostridia bacterium]
MFKRFLGFIKKGKQLHIWFFSYLAIVFIGVLLSTFLYSSSVKIVRNQTEKNMSFTVDQMRVFYDEDFLSIQNAAYSVLDDATLQEVAREAYTPDPTEQRLRYKNICKRIASHMNDSILHFFVLFEDFDLALDSAGSSTKMP